MTKLFYRFSRSTGSMFWALFDQAELEDFNTKDTTFEITQETGKLLFAFYSICIIMVALNMLIATMTHSYDCISVRNFIYTAKLFSLEDQERVLISVTSCKRPVIYNG